MTRSDLAPVVSKPRSFSCVRRKRVRRRRHEEKSVRVIGAVQVSQARVQANTHLSCELSSGHVAHALHCSGAWACVPKGECPHIANNFQKHRRAPGVAPQRREDDVQGARDAPLPLSTFSSLELSYPLETLASVLSDEDEQTSSEKARDGRAAANAVCVPVTAERSTGVAAR